MAITVNYYPKKQKRFSYGLGQDVGSLRTIIKIVQVFMPHSPMQEEVMDRFDWKLKDETLKQRFVSLLNAETVELSVTDLTAEYNKTTGKPAVPFAKSILGALLDGQKDAITSDGDKLFKPNGEIIKTPMRAWALRNYVSMTIGLGLLEWNRKTGCVKLTEVGKELALTKHGVGKDLTHEEQEKLSRIFMSYPYAVSFLRALSLSGKPMTKFELGENFGFSKEAGFTAFGEDIFLESVKDTYENEDKKLRNKITSNWESTADKYIRGLASLLGQLKFVKVQKKTIEFQLENKTSKRFQIPSYKLTGAGRAALGIAEGKSSHKRTIKNVSWDMLATKGEVVYIRTVRALILKSLIGGKKLTTLEIAKKVNANKVNEKYVLQGEAVTPEEVADHIEGLNGIGLEIIEKHKKYELKDQITDFEIPVVGSDLPKKTNVMKLQDQMRPYLTMVDHRYLQLIELALDSDSNDLYAQFESLTMEFIIKQLGFSGMTLGGASKPDGFAWDNDGNSLIIDTKAYDKGYSLANNTDKVWRYINDVRKRDSAHTNKWWQSVPETLNVKNDLKFIYVSGSFTGNYRKLLGELRARADAPGGLVEVSKLLLTGEKFLRARGAMSRLELINNWVNDDIDYDEYSTEIIKELI